MPPPPTSYLLDNTGYDMATHPAESADWVNVVGAQILQGYRNDLLSSGGEEGARKQFERWLNPPGRTLSWLVSFNDSAELTPGSDRGHLRQPRQDVPAAVEREDAARRRPGENPVRDRRRLCG